MSVKNGNEKLVKVETLGKIVGDDFVNYDPETLEQAFSSIVADSEGHGARTKVALVEYRQENRVSPYVHQPHVYKGEAVHGGQTLTGDIFRNHFGRLVKFAQNKKGETYLTIVDWTRFDIEKKKFAVRSVNLGTVSYLAINGIEIIKDSKVISKPIESFVMRQAWKENGKRRMQSEALENAWKRVKEAFTAQ